MIGIIGMYSNRKHINLAFTKKEYHRQGVATSIFQYLLADILKDAPKLHEITLIRHHTVSHFIFISDLSHNQTSRIRRD